MTDPALPPDPGLPRNPEVLHLTHDELERIASGEPSVTDSRWIDHLDQCEYCREQLTRTAADRSFWQQSSDLLRSVDVGEEASLAPDGDADGETSADEATALIVRSLLAPTEWENSLGRLGRFEVLGIVGSGGMGIVLKCRDVDIERVVAIKIPSAQLWRCREALETLEREARSAASVVHPHVIAIYQVDRWRDVPYLVMPYFPAPSLDRRIDRDGPLQPAEAIRITRQMAEALAAAHAHGVIHRDVKPGNILLGRGVERAVLSDFGLAKVQSEATLTASGLLAGTPSYLSPEQAKGARVGPPSDLFSLASVLWTMLAGEVPWAGLHPHAIIHRIATGQLPPLETARAPLPPWLPRLLEWMHRIDPSERPGSAGELAELLKACERHMSDPETHPLPEKLEADETPPRTRRRWGPIAWIAASMLLVVSLAATPLLWIGHEADAPAEVTAPKPQTETERESHIAAGAGSSPAAGPETPADASDTDPSDISPEAVDAMLDDVEASTQKILSELQDLQESNP